MMNTHQLARKIVGVLVFCVVFSGASIWAHAQFTSAIAGSVTDPTGAVVPNATVTINNVETGASRSLNTGAEGYYRFASLPAAMFDLTVTAPGFSTLFNIFNRVNLAGVHSDLSDPLFSKSTSTFAARDIQFALRLSF